MFLLIVNVVVQCVQLWHTAYLVREIDSVKSMLRSSGEVLSAIKTAAIGGAIDKAFLVKDGVKHVADKLKEYKWPWQQKKTEL